MSELLKTLHLVKALSGGPLSALALRQLLGVSNATLNRHLAEARHLGAQIKAVQAGRAWTYHLENWPACERTVGRWIELEEARTIV